MKLKVKKLVPEAVLPKKANESDAGYDLVAINDGTITGKYIEYNIGLSIEVPEGYHTEIYPRSSVSKYDLVLANSIGVIDHGYRGPLICRFKIITKDNFVNPTVYKKGDKIAQLLVKKTEHFEIEEVQDLSETERGEGGFGSSGN